MIELLLACSVALNVGIGVVWVYDTWRLGRAANDDR